MVFLHPDQAQLVERSFSGPARVRGGAGTGKTVVGLHRARHLAREGDGPVLFTTYVRNLPPVFGELFTRLERSSEGRVDFLNLHKVAHRLVSEVEGSPSIDLQGTNAVFANAWRRATRGESELEARGLSRNYVRQELDWVIKGRGLTSLDNYLALPRTGRGTPLGPDARREAWDLYVDYQGQLQQLGLMDFNDLLNRAIELLLLGRIAPPYRAVIVDEAQDLTEMGLRLTHLLAGPDRDNNLFILGDGQQAVYPGGFNLSNIGIDIIGRSSVLRVNYRNPEEVDAFAWSLVSGSSYEDLDGEPQPGTREETTLVRQGGEVEATGFDSLDEHDMTLIARIDELARRGDTGPGDIAVLVPTNAMVTEYASRIEGLGLRTQKLQQYDGVTNELVKVGTYQRAKGLEFKRVFVPRLDADGLNDHPFEGEDETSRHERMELIRRQVFVAVTRARDGVWAGWVSEPSELLCAIDEMPPE
nr:UvrD-helicase domain-containing protein [Salsipaludibacter albus]